MPIDFDVTDKVATIVINRPEALNSMTQPMYKALSDAWIEVRDNPDIWVAVVTGAPQPSRPPERQVFTAGADLRSMNRERGVDQYWQTQKDPILNRGLEVWKPVVAAVNGLCLAGGMTLLMATDIRIGSEYSAYDLSEVKRGILPGNGGTQRTARQLPYPVAMEVLLAGKRLTAQRAAQWNLPRHTCRPLDRYTGARVSADLASYDAEVDDISTLEDDLPEELAASCGIAEQLDGDDDL
mgnify:CR=1 FL=1